MAKDAYYFPHDSNARHDPKLIKLELEYGQAGYAYYFKTLEIIRDLDGYFFTKNDIAAFSYSLQFPDFSAFVKRCIELDLLVDDGGKIHSESFTNRMQQLESKRERMKKIASKGGQASHAQASDAQADVGRVVKESKVKESKVKRESVFTPPTFLEIQEYCGERKGGVDPKRFFNFYESKGWMVGKNKMKDWKAAVRNWENRDTKPTNNDPMAKYANTPRL